MKDIYIKGAKEHNLKDIDVRIPRDKFVVITGLSGSGKSSLAFDTIYAEGQRRYVESLSAYARQFLGQMEKPNVEFIEGLSPAISIDQKTTSRNPRSTVGTVTEIYDYLRLLFARVGIPHCPECGKPIVQQSVDQIVDQVKVLPERSKLLLLAPVVRGRKGTHKKLFQDLGKEGFVRVRVNGEIRELSDSIELEKNKKHTIEVVVDRLIVKADMEQRLSDSIETALGLSDGLLNVQIVDGEELRFSTKFACPDHGMGIEELEPRMFSFNAPYGSCPVCNGLGHMREIDEKLVVPNRELSVNDGAISPMASSGEGTYYIRMMLQILEDNGDSGDTPFNKLTAMSQEELLYGTKDRVLSFEYESKYGGTRTYQSPFEGIIPNLQRRYSETNSDYMRGRIEDYMSMVTCHECHGRRLKPEVLAVKVGALNISEVTDLSIRKAVEFFNSLEMNETQTKISDLILKEINARLKFLSDVGLNYLTLSRAAGTLSGGEAQRIRLATQIGSGLVGVLYILDEPSIGLHQKDNDKLIKTLRHLTDIGNTLIVVEHDEDTIRQADHIIDIGPGAGEHGGVIIAEGPIEDILSEPNSITGQYLVGTREIKIPEVRRKPNGKWLAIKGASENNLRDIDVNIPLGIMTAITGVSGSGKSSLINQILYKTVQSTLIKRSKLRPGAHKSIEGIEHIDKVIDIDQSPIGRTPRSNPATYTGVFDHIRDLFASTPEAKMRGYQKGRFSFNVKGGRCENCKGDGIIKIEMHFLPDVYVPCDVCKGKRYNRETLQVRYKGKTIDDVLKMTVEDGLEFFDSIPKIKRKLETLNDVGLGYIRLGQPSTQLSGGEAQRIKLASELSKRATGKTLYILDEPTTGLHMADVEHLIKVLQRLVDTGNSIVVIEHNLDVIKCADYIIDLGPDGGDGGGLIVATGTPEEVSKVKGSYTGEYLTRMI